MQHSTILNLTVSRKCNGPGIKGGCWECSFFLLLQLGLPGRWTVRRLALHSTKKNIQALHVRQQAPSLNRYKSCKCKRKAGDKVSAGRAHKMGRVRHSAAHLLCFNGLTRQTMVSLRTTPPPSLDIPKQLTHTRQVLPHQAVSFEWGRKSLDAYVVNTQEKRATVLRRKSD